MTRQGSVDLDFEDGFFSVFGGHCEFSNNVDTDLEERLDCYYPFYREGGHK
jgi:hypothetical protein